MPTVQEFGDFKQV